MAETMMEVFVIAGTFMSMTFIVAIIFMVYLKNLFLKITEENKTEIEVLRNIIEKEVKDIIGSSKQLLEELSNNKTKKK